MKPVGLIANPNSGKDIRRLVAHGSVFGNQEKVNIVRRLLLAMDGVGVERVVIMPDTFRIGARALDGVDLKLQASHLDMDIEGNQDDSTRAAQLMAEMGVACIVTLGGDGTNRVVAKSCGDVPLLPISTGTNNVFSFMMESTLAGMAAGAMAKNSFPRRKTCRRMPRLEICRSSRLVDIALVDVVVTEHGFAGARAIWDESTVREIFLTRAEPNQIGFSSVGGAIMTLKPGSGQGMHIVIGPGDQEVMAPIAPGLMRWLSICSHRVFHPGEQIPIARTPSFLALDGEREIYVGRGDELTVRINPCGPFVVDVERVLGLAREAGCFTRLGPQRMVRARKAGANVSRG